MFGVLFCFLIHFRWFTHFYAWGILWIWSLTLTYFLRCIPIPLHIPKSIPVLSDVIMFVTGGFLRNNCSVVTQHHVDAAVVLSMLSFQVARRLYECLYVSVFSDARMHVLHYILGMYFYPAVAFTALLHLDASDLKS